MVKDDSLGELLKEAEGTQDFMRSTYGRVGKSDFFQQAVLRGMATIIKLLIWQVRHT